MIVRALVLVVIVVMREETIGKKPERVDQQKRLLLPNNFSMKDQGQDNL